MEKEKKEKNFFRAIFIGVFLIALVALVTLFRLNVQKEKNELSASKATEKKIVSEEKNIIKAEELLKKITQQENIIILDIRDEGEYKKEHLRDSLNIPFINLQEKISSLEKNKTYVLVDEGPSSQAAFLAIQLFLQNKISSVFYLQGGFSFWKSEYNPTVSEGDPNSFVDQSKVQYIKSEELKNLISQDPKLVIIDLRKPAAFQEGHLKGAQNIFLEDLEKESSNLTRSRKIVLYDKDGLWAFQGAVRLFDLGFFNVLALSDGLDGWKEKKFELEKQP